MGRTQLLKQSFWILLRHPALWVISLAGIVVGFVASAVFLDASAASAMIRMIVAFLTIAFTSGALISMIDSLANEHPVTVNDGIRVGLRHMTQLALIDLTLIIPTWIILYAVTGEVATLFTSELGQPGGLLAINAVAYIGSFLGAVGLVILVILITGVIGIGAKRAVMLEDQSVLAALQRGWQLLRTHLIDYVVIGTMLLGLVIVLGFLFAATIGQIVTSMLPGQGGTIEPAAMYTNPIGIAWIVFNLLLSALIEVFASGVWTLAYRQWRADNVITPSSD